MKTKLTMLFACAALLCQTIFGLDFSAVRNFKPLGKGKKIVLRDGKRTLGTISARKGGDSQLVKVSVKNGELEIDTRACFDAAPNAEVVLQLFCVPKSDVKPEKQARLIVEMCAAEADTKGAFSLIGTKRPDAKGKRNFYAKPTPLQLSDQQKKFTYSRLVPADAATLHALFYLKKGVYRIRSASVDYPEQAAGSADSDKK